MDLDDEAPPDLVEVSGAADEEQAKEVPFKVPITIVSGMPSFVVRATVTGRILTVLSRVPGGWQDDSVELHSDSSAWKESCCYNER